MCSVVCVCWCDGSVGGRGSGFDGGGDVSGDGDEVGGNGGEYFYGLFIEIPLEVGRLSHFPTIRFGTSWSRNALMLLYYHRYEVSPHPHN